MELAILSVQSVICGCGTAGSTTPAGVTAALGGVSADAGLPPHSSKKRTFNEMAFVIDRQSVVAKTRALKAEYTSELAQDLKAVHGLDAETELANILSAEILAEINREVIRSIYTNAKLGCQQPDLKFKSSVLPLLLRTTAMGLLASVAFTMWMLTPMVVGLPRSSVV